MARKNLCFVAVLALAVMVSGCDSVTSLTPSSLPPQPSVSTVNMSSFSPQEGGSLAYGGFGSRVEVRYTVASDLNADLAYGGVIILSCLSEDGQNIIRDSCAGKLVHEQTGTVTNDPGLGSHYRGRIAQTQYVINQMRLYRNDSVVVSALSPLVWNFE